MSRNPDTRPASHDEPDGPTILGNGSHSQGGHPAEDQHRGERQLCVHKPDHCHIPRPRRYAYLLTAGELRAIIRGTSARCPPRNVVAAAIGSRPARPDGKWKSR
ncbi:hypothetical protein GCM10022207_82050 [Streptomyces lannensis]|uniref:Uncharacterized protein n=1 Tax=Streptomyces lannensis TaxID=766498 RepID=A0ABP7LH52_9ACTN